MKDKRESVFQNLERNACSDGRKSQCEGPGVGLRTTTATKWGRRRAPALESDLSDRLCSRSSCLMGEWVVSTPSLAKPRSQQCVWQVARSWHSAS